MSLRAALDKPLLERTDAEGWRAGRPRLGATGLAEILAPDGIDRSASGSLQAGDSWLATLEVRSFPPSLGLAWLSDPALGLERAGVTVHQRIEPVSDGEARRLLARSEDAALGTLSGDVQAGTNIDVEAEQGMHAATALRREVVAGSDRLFRYAITVTIAAASAADLASRVEAIQCAAAQQGVQLGNVRFQQWEGYQSALPLARFPLDLLHDTSGRAVAMGLPTAAPGLRHRPGGLPLVWGEHPRTGEPVVWDRWQATNPHALVVAESGSGKSYGVSGLLIQELALGDDAVLLLDPKFQEYRTLVQNLGGAYISLSGRSGYHINPLALPQLPPERAILIRELGEDLLAQRIAVVRALISRAFLGIGLRLQPGQLALLERAILESYASRGISDDPATFSQPMPTFSDVRNIVAAQGSADPRAAELADALRVFTEGTIGALFNQPSNIPTDNPLLALDLSGLLRSQDELLEQLLPVIVMDFFVGVAIHRPTGRRSHLVLDEAHALLHSEAGARTLQMIFRIGRSLKFKATVITQSLDDLDESEQTRVLLENARTKLLLGLNRDSDAVGRAAALLGLNEQEAAYLAGCRLVPGIGATALLLADGERTPLLIPQWPPTIHRAITGAPAPRSG